MLDSLSGATRLTFIIGDPIAQVKSPAGVTAGLRERGADAVCVPAHVRPADFVDFVRMCQRMPNVDGLVVTVPHKFAALPLCATLAPRAQSIGTVNMMRRNPDGTWHGDMSDGQGFVAAMRLTGAHLPGRRALLVGAGGAGSGIAHALVDAGVAELALHDPDIERRDALADRLRRYGSVPISIGSEDPSGFALVCNASPMGMREGDPLPVRIDRLDADAFVADVVTQPAVPPLIAAARVRGVGTSTGTQMFEQVRECIVDFLMGA